MRYDAYRCTDKSVRGAVSILPSIAENVAETINADPQAAKEAGFAALELENSFPEDTSPEWLVAHGIGVYQKITESSLFGDDVIIDNWCIPKSQWHAVREEIRNNAETSFNTLE